MMELLHLRTTRGRRGVRRPARRRRDGVCAFSRQRRDFGAGQSGLDFASTALLYPVYSGGDADRAGASGGLGWVEIAGGEVVIGLLLGLTLQFVLEARGVAGQIMGIQTGFSLVNILDPQTQVDTPVLSAFHQIIVLLIFLRLNVHHWLLRGLAASFSYLPPGGDGVNFAAVGSLLRAAAAFGWPECRSRPRYCATLLCDVALGFLGKASPQLPVMFFGVSIKSLLGLLVLTGTLALWPRFWNSKFVEAIGAERAAAPFSAW